VGGALGLTGPAAQLAEQVPELGPMLGRLATEPGPAPAEVLLGEVRLTLLTALFARAGLARHEAAAGRSGPARSHLALVVWLALWRDAAALGAARVEEEIDRRFRTAAAESRMPGRLLRRRLPHPEVRQARRTRCDSAGIPLERIPPPELAADWAAGLLTAAMALDESWGRLVATVAGELTRHQAEIESVRRWERPAAGLWTIAGATMLGAMALGLSLGGYLPAPGFLGVLQRWFWSLPWP
jgi:hypothetical protein